MARRGQSRNAPKRAKQATRSSEAFIGWRNYRGRPGADATRDPQGHRLESEPSGTETWHEALGQELLEACLQFLCHRRRHLLGRARALLPLALAPALEIGVLSGRI